MSYSLTGLFNDIFRRLLNALARFRAASTTCGICFGEQSDTGTDICLAFPIIIPLNLYVRLSSRSSTKDQFDTKWRKRYSD